MHVIYININRHTTEYIIHNNSVNNYINSNNINNYINNNNSYNIKLTTTLTTTFIATQ